MDRTGIFAELYDSPWDEAPRKVWFHSEDCTDAYIRGDYDISYYTCDSCYRDICQRNPRNGWMEHFRELEGRLLCLRCFEIYILQHGIDRDSFASGKITGMFFSGDNREPIKAGYEPVPGFEYFFINSHDSVSRYCEGALELIDSGHQVLTGYERLAIGGLEGYVTMFARFAAAEVPEPERRRLK